ncbi:MAG: head-tail connector protein [Marinibacterium sp.]|nr:head-tail connector protein [Marinibacterium sp.]
MRLTEETGIADADLPLEPFKAHLRLGTGFAEDGLQDAVLSSFLRAAIAAIEARTAKVLYERDFRWHLSAWRDGVAQVLPVAPVVAVTALRLVDRHGVETAIAADAWALEADSQQPRLRAVGGSLPGIPHLGEAVIDLSAGLSPDWDGLPADLAQAVLMLAAHYYEYRHETTLGDGCMPFGVTSLLQRYRPMRIGFGGRA